jgi:hypothetical protein
VDAAPEPFSLPAVDDAESGVTVRAFLGVAEFHTRLSRGTQFAPARFRFLNARSPRFRSAASFGSPSRVAFFAAATSALLTGCGKSVGITSHM